MKYLNQHVKLGFLMIFGISMLLNSCTDPIEQENSETTVAEDKVNIQNTFDGILVCVENFKNGNSVDVLFRDFLNLSNGEPLNDVWIEELTTDLSSVINLDNIENNQRFDIAFYSATYTYNIANSTWSKTLDQTNKVVFKFPSSPAETSNNAELIIGSYADKSVTIGAETIYLPTSFDVVFNVDGTRITEINLNDIQYASNADFEIPVVINIDIYLNPVDISFVVSRNSTTDFSLEFTLSDEDACDVSLIANLELNHDDYENLKETDIKNITVELQLNDLKIQSLSGIAEFIKSENQSENDFNTLIDIEVLFNEEKIGDLKWDETKEVFIIIYKDGTEEDTAVYHEGFVDDLKDIWLEFMG